MLTSVRARSWLGVPFAERFEITLDNDLLADAVRDLVIGDISEHDFADILYSSFIASQYQA